MCHSNNRKFNLMLRSADAVSTQTFDCSGFVARYINPKKKYKMKIVYFGTNGNQGNVSNIILHLPFFQTENSQVVNSTGEVMTSPFLALHHQAHSSHLAYTGDAVTEYVGTFSTTQFQVYLTTSDMVTPQTLAVSTNFLLQLQFEEEEEDD